MENHENLIGKILGERYRIESIVGEGGMSVVMRAYDAVESKDVTIKLLNLKNNSDQNAVERFINEAKAVALLCHPNIVSVYDISLDGPSKFIVMEYIKGITLKKYLDKKGRLEWREAVHYINQILAALSHAHEKGVIHRDIKPENVMLMRDGSIKVIDFGIAKLPDSKSLTVIDKAIGTVNYISPEQASGHGSTEKSDIYSTGIMLYELVTGQLPFVSASSVSVAMMHVSSEPAMPSSICDSIPTGLEQIIIKAMMKSPDKRFGSATAMKKALEYLLEYPTTIFKENSAVGADGKPILSTGAVQNIGNNTVITEEISPDNRDEDASISEDDEEYAENERGNNDEDDDDENEDEYSYVKPSKPSMLPIVLGVTAAFFTIAILFAVLAFNKFGSIVTSDTPRDSEINTLTVPNLIDKEYSQELYNELTEMGFNVTVKEVSNVKVENGHIISQEPLALSKRKKKENGVQLTLEVSRGSSELYLDDYTHYHKGGARITLEGLGLNVKIEEEHHDTVIIDHIIRTSPESGDAVFEGDTITLYVSKGPKDLLVKIPESILGLNYDRAEYILQDYGIKVDQERGAEYSDEYEKDMVIGTEPAIGSMVSVNNDKVKIILSKGSTPETDAVETGAIVQEVPDVTEDEPGITEDKPGVTEENPSVTEEKPSVTEESSDVTDASQNTEDNNDASAELPEDVGLSESIEESSPQQNQVTDETEQGN